MRTLSLKTRTMRPEERRAQSKQCLVEGLRHDTSARAMETAIIFPTPAKLQAASRHALPKAFLSYRSMHGHFYYPKRRTARSRSASSAEAAACGMRWNFYLSSGTHTPHFAFHEHHTATIASGLMNDIRHNGSGEAAGARHAEAHAHQHTSGYDAPVVTAQSAGYSPGVVQAIQMAQANDSPVQGSAGPGNPQHVTFSFSIFTSGNAEQAGPGQGARLHQHTETGTHHAAHTASAAHTVPFSSAAPLPASFTGAQADAGTQPRQMDISLAIAYNPLSQLSYVPTYQVGAYAPSFAAAQISPAAISFEPQGFSAAAPQGTTAAVRQQEIGYFGSEKRKAVVLKVAQAADAVPE